MGYENNLILVEKSVDKVALIALNDLPFSLVTLELNRELEETLFRLEQGDEIWVVVLAGSGEKAFYVGFDVKKFPLVWNDVIGKKLQKENEVFDATEFLDKPVIAAIEGNACSGDYEMAMACNLRVLSESGRIAQLEIGLGVFPGSGRVFRLPKLAGVSKATEVTFSGELIDAEDCLRPGLVNRLAPTGRTVSVALDLAEGIVHKPFETIKLIRRGVRKIGMVSSDKCSHKNLELSRSIFKTEDCKGGVDAFLGKCSPQFR